jgi:hypothetical protein
LSRLPAPHTPLVRMYGTEVRCGGDQSGVSERLQLRTVGLEWREIEGEVVAVDLEGSVYLAINRTGAALWPSLAEGATRNDLIRTLIDRYELNESTAAADVDSFVAMLKEQNLVEASAT